MVLTLERLLNILRPPRICFSAFIAAYANDEGSDLTSKGLFSEVVIFSAFMRQLANCLQALVAASIFFVWVVRYPNIVEEFKAYGLSERSRDLVGIFKLTFALLLLIGIERPFFAVVGGIGIFLLMGAAVLTHLRVKNPVVKMLPSLALIACSALISWINYRLPG
jgi:uncharacterized membrane protein YphA (DoxX/SURF4 family)